MILNGFYPVNNSGRLGDLPLFSYLRIVFLSPKPAFFGANYNPDFVRLKPSYLQWVTDFENVPTAIGEPARIERNPTIIKKPDLTLPITAIDVTGFSPLNIYFYDEA